MSFYRTETGRKVMFSDIAQAIETLHPKYRGKHIFEQLSVLGLYGEFRRSTTPVGLPYSFTEYLEETTCSTASNSISQMAELRAA